MDDTVTCPICNNKLRTTTSVSYLFPVKKLGDFIERSCVLGVNHTIQFFTDMKTCKVDFLRISLNPKYSIFLEVDYVNERCRIACMKNSKPTYIEIPKMLDLDFPSLDKIKAKVEMYVTFS